jgi:hypothetical protein
MPERKKNWFTLDNAAKLYPAIHSERLPMVFSVSATLTTTINADSLQDALDTVMPRFPYYKVRLRAGFFWYYLENNPARVVIRAETDTPCRVLPDYDGNGFLFRVQAYKRRIAVEFSHILTDGTGALTFLKSLIVEYLHLRGHPAEEMDGILRSTDDPDPEEFEDAYARFNTRVSPKPDRLKRAFRLPYPLKPVHRHTCLTGECSSDAVYHQAKMKGVSVTEYLAGVYLFVLQGIYRDLPAVAKQRAKKTARMQIPVNLRKLYPSKTMRNFSLFVTPGIDMRLGWYDLDDIIKRVHRYMKNEADTRHIDQQLSRNQNFERSVFVRSMPLLLKNAVIHSTYTNLGPTQYSGVLTNLGRVRMPPSIEGEIESFTFIPPPGKELRVHGAMATFGDKMRITFGNVTDVMEVQRRFFCFLVDAGIHVRLYRYKDV